MTRSTGTIVLTGRQIAAMASPRDYLQAVRNAFLDLAARRYVLPEVGHIAARDGAFHIKAAALQGPRPMAVVKVNGNFAGNAARGLPTIQGFIALLDAEVGSVLALLDSVEITARRTAAATALATQLLARRDAAVAGFIGCGVQAGYHLEALLDVVSLREIRCCDPRDDAVDAFLRRAASLSAPADRVSTPAAAARGADIVVTLTTSARPVLALADVAAGTFVAGVGADSPSKHELAPDLLCASRVVPDVLDQSAALGDLGHAIRAGVMAAGDIHGELAQLVSGMLPARTSDNERFVFDSTGVAIQDLAAAMMIYERARDRLHRTEAVSG